MHGWVLVIFMFVRFRFCVSRIIEKYMHLLVPKRYYFICVRVYYYMLAVSKLLIWGCI